MNSWVLTSQEMARIERAAISEGSSAEEFMKAAASKVAAIVQSLADPNLPIALLIGKGNKGGDAFAAGAILLEHGFEVTAYTLHPKEECSPLNQLMRDRFAGPIVEGTWDFSRCGIIVDGLLGTGFSGELDPRIRENIRLANQSGLPIIAIDLPSGLNGTTGEGAESAIQASRTVALGSAKLGCFLKNGWNCVGKLTVEDFGLPFVEAEVSAELPTWDFLHKTLPPLIRNRHKYQAGYVLGFGGSKHFSGAPKLSGWAALRAGAGIVRLFHPKETAMETAPWELIHQEWDESSWNEEMKRAQAVFVGPGLGKEADRWLKAHLSSIPHPCVLDAEALVPEKKWWPKQSIFTPHRGEVLRLLGLTAAPKEEVLLSLCQKLCDETGTVLVLKGGPTFVFGPKRVPMIIPFGDPGMATAGTGDVLTGILAALLAQGLACFEAAVLGACLHALAGEFAASEKTSYSLVASDLIEALPLAFQKLM